MNFRKATDALLESITLEDLAEALGASVQSVRQARTVEGTSSYRTPPAGWERATAKLARGRAGRLERLAGRLEAL